MLSEEAALLNIDTEYHRHSIKMSTNSFRITDKLKGELVINGDDIQTQRSTSSPMFWSSMEM
jgi:hypothetical protein